MDTRTHRTPSPLLGALVCLAWLAGCGGEDEGDPTAQTKAAIRRMEGAVEQYRADTDNSAGPKSVEVLLKPKMVDGEPLHYLSEHPKDGWGNPLNYKPAKSPLIWSNGPDGKDEQGKGDDINNWSERKKSK